MRKEKKHRRKVSPPSLSYSSSYKISGWLSYNTRLRVTPQPAVAAYNVNLITEIVELLIYDLHLYVPGVDVILLIPDPFKAY